MRYVNCKLSLSCLLVYQTITFSDDLTQILCNRPTYLCVEKDSQFTDLIIYDIFTFKLWFENSFHRSIMKVLDCGVLLKAGPRPATAQRPGGPRPPTAQRSGGPVLISRFFVQR